MPNIAKILCFFMFIIILGCSNNTPENNEPTVEPRNDKPVMEINGQTVYENDFYNFAGYVLREMDENHLSNTAVKEQLVKEFTEHILLLQEAEKRGITPDNNSIAKITETIETSQGTQNLKVYSGHYDTSSRVLTDLLHQRLIVETLLKDVINSRVSVSEEEIKERYNQKESKETPETKAHILHIFTLKEETAQQAMQELRKGLSFTEVAQRYSQGPEKKYGGDLGFISDADFPEIFAEAFKLPEGKYSHIVKSDYGYHIFFVKKISKPKKIIYNDVKNKIYFDLYSQKQEETMREFVDELYNNADIKHINDIDIMGYSVNGGNRQ